MLPMMKVASVHRPWYLAGNCLVQTNLPKASPLVGTYMPLAYFSHDGILMHALYQPAVVLMVQHMLQSEAVCCYYISLLLIYDVQSPMMKFPNKGVSQNIRSARSRAFACAGLRADAVYASLDVC